METVLLYGQDKGCELADTLFGAVRAAGCTALHVAFHSVSIIPPGTEAPEFLVLEQDTVPEMHVGSGVLVFKPGVAAFRRDFCVPGGFSAVVDPLNEDAVRLLQKCCLQTVTCGMSLRDTLTFSSIGGETAVVSLQRALVTLKGETVEPREIPVRFGNGHGQYALLAAVAVLLLCGRMPENELWVP